MGDVDITLACFDVGCGMAGVRLMSLLKVCLSQTENGWDGSHPQN